MRMSDSAARGFLAAMVGSALVAGCGGQGSPTEQSPSVLGQVEGAVSRSVPGQVSTLGTTVTKVTAGNQHVFAITSDNNRWGWGFNAFGQAGTGSSTPSALAVPTGLSTSLSSVSSFAGGKLHSVVLQGSDVLTYGFNLYGQLGDGTTNASTTPVIVFPFPATKPAKAVAAGWHHTVALMNDGTLWAWGYNVSGALGDGTSITRTAPVQVTGLSGVTITAIAAGGENTYALDSNGDVWAWGLNSDQQLGVVADPRTVPQKVPSLSSVKAISAGSFSLLALKTDGTVWKTGGNSAPAQVSGLSNIQAIAVGGTTGTGHHYLAVDGNGALWSWGYNADGQLGDCTTTTQTTPVQVRSNCSLPASYLTGVVSVSGSDRSSFALLGDGTLWSWGYDGSGILGTNNS